MPSLREWPLLWLIVAREWCEWAAHTLEDLTRMYEDRVLADG